MSWMKQVTGGAAPGASAGPAPQPYAAPQAQTYANQQNMYQNYPPGSTNSQQPATQQSYWPQQPQYNQQYAPAYSQEPQPNANQFYQQPGHYNQNYNNQGYNNPSQNYQQTYYQNQPQQQNYQQNSAPNDGWEDNWDWGWEESAKQAQKAQNNIAPQPPQPEQAYNNANVIEESFVPSNNWNWAVDDKKAPQESPASPNQDDSKPTPQSNPIQHDRPPEPSSNAFNAPVAAEDVRTLSDRDIVKEKMPNLALGKRFHLDNLTPQWSIESQMSQESSDGPQTHSESTYRSENHSRNSNSPGPNNDNSNCKFSQSRLDENSELYSQNSEWSRQSDEPTIADSIQTSNTRESHDELSYSMQDLTLTNHENVAPDNLHMNQQLDPGDSQQSASRPPAASSPSLLPPPAQYMPSLPNTSSAPTPQAEAPSIRPPANLPPLPPTSSVSPVVGSQLPPQSISSLPPPNFPPLASNSQNPFKHAGLLAHKAKPSSTAPVQPQPFTPQTSGASLMSPTVVNKVSQQHRTPIGFEANLETTPDNSERPDHPQMPGFRPTAGPAQLPDNMEVAPQNDRNEYLQTAHLSSGDYGENRDFTRGAPPPGLRRMVVGQHESEYGQPLNISGDEPPPGLSRMVPGQQTEGERAADDYRERLIDGRPTDGARPYRQAEGQRSPEPYGSERRPVGRDRPAADDYPQYAAGGGDRRVVTGLERQSLDGADYERAPPDDLRRDGTMEGENLQDLSLASSADLAYSRDQTLEGAPPPPDRADRSASPERPPAAERRASLTRARSSNDDSERDRAFRASPRRDRHKASRDRERDRDRDRDRERDGRYSRDRKYERGDDRKPPRDERRTDKDRRLRDRDRDRDRDRERRERDDSPEQRRLRRSTRSRRYDTEDTDYYSDKDRDRRRARDDERPERRYRDIDPSRTSASLRRERHDRRDRHHDHHDDRRRGDTYSSPSRPDSREAPPTDEEGGARRRERRHRAHRPLDPYYDEYGSGAYGEYMTAQQYEYYRRLRLHDPAAYSQLYKRLVAAAQQPHLPLAGYSEAGYEVARDDRPGLHSGRSSAHLRSNDTYAARRDGSLRDTDLSDRELGTEGSLHMQLDASTVRSERMTPHRFATAHIKGSMSGRALVVVQPSWPVDGRPATVQLLSLAKAASDAPHTDLLRAPTPLIKGVTHKKTVVEYCLTRARQAAREGAPDPLGYRLLWELLALALTHNGVVVGSDIAELLMRNTHEHPHTPHDTRPHHEERRGSSAEDSDPAADEHTHEGAGAGAEAEAHGACADEAAALARLRDLLLAGNKHEAVEWAISQKLWGHALSLAAHMGRRARAAAAARFLAAVPRADPLHSLYCAWARAPPPAAAALGARAPPDWRPHAAIVLANPSADPQHDAASLAVIGDALAARGLLYSAQVVYVASGVEFAPHPVAPLSPAPAAAAPPRLSLLLGEARAASLGEFASDRAIVATEIYEYAMSLSREQYTIPALQPYKVVAAARLLDAGDCERALAYAESAARALTLAPHLYHPRLLAVVADLADRLKYHDPALSAEGAAVTADEEADTSPRHHWLDHLRAAATHLQAQSAAPTPLHPAPPAPAPHWDQMQQYQPQQPYQEQPYQPPPASDPPVPEETPAPASTPAPVAPTVPEQYAPEWHHSEEHHAQTYAEPDYWQHDPYSYNEGGGGEEARPTITMPGSPSAGYSYDDEPADAKQQTDQARDSPDQSKPSPGGGGAGRGAGGAGGGGWLGGILTKLSLRAPNQMILPDDTNPTIVWDADAKRWKNLDGDEGGAEQPPPPPPRLPPPAATHPTPSGSPPLAGAPPAGAPPTNIFKMQKGRHIKQAYVDVFNPRGAGSTPAAAPPAPPPAAPAPLPAPTYFVPAPTPAQGGETYDPGAYDQYRSGI